MKEREAQRIAEDARAKETQGKEGWFTPACE